MGDSGCHSAREHNPGHVDVSSMSYDSSHNDTASNTRALVFSLTKWAQCLPDKPRVWKDISADIDTQLLTNESKLLREVSYLDILFYSN